MVVFSNFYIQHIAIYQVYVIFDPPINETQAITFSFQLSMQKLNNDNINFLH
jgi:hypothetical protein